MRAARLLLVEDDEAFAYALGERLRAEGLEVASARTSAEAVAVAERAPPDLAVVDFQLPDGTGIELARRLRVAAGDLVPSIMITSFGSIDGAVDAIRAGCVDYVPKDRNLETIVLRVSSALELLELRARVSRYEETFARQAEESGLTGHSEAIALVRQQVRAAAAAADTTVLICGESGTGKQLVARAIHHASPRRDRPFVEVDCTTLAPNLVESELFGHERGAFTGAGERKLGLVEMAHGGTLFLDEIGELEPSSQAKLLRLLQERSFRRVGGVREHKVDVRIIAATNRVLADELARGRFREDLYYRVRVLSIAMPPLRERGDDVVVLARAFVAELARKLGKPDARLGAAAVERLRAYRFPGNVRELRAVIEQALVRSDGSEIEATLLPDGDGAGSRRGRPRDEVSEVDAERIREAMDSAYGNQSKAADALGMSRFALKRRLKRLVDDDEGARRRR